MCGYDGGGIVHFNNEEALRVLTLYDHSGPKYHRCLLPLLLMPGIELTVAPRLTNELLADCDILFVNRMIAQPENMSIEEMINGWRKEYGFKLIVDNDDHWDLGRDHYMSSNYERFGVSKTIVDFMRVADAVTVTHERLAEEAKEFNSNVHVLPNAIPDYDQFKCKKQEDYLVRLFWAGSITHLKDIELLKRPLQLIKRDKAKLVMGGFARHPDWVRMAKIFTCDSSYNTEVIQAMQVERYYYMYSKCDIALIPLLDTKFNRFKSNLKILEAAHIGSPVIVSRVHPYLDFPEELVNYVSGNDTWFKQINKLLKDHELVKEQGKALKAYCESNFDFNLINLKRKKIFDEVSKQGSIGEVPNDVHEPERVGELSGDS